MGARGCTTSASENSCGNAARNACASSAKRLVHLEQQPCHFSGPPQAQFLRKEFQFAQNMHAIHALDTLVTEIGCPGVMDQGAHGSLHLIESPPPSAAMYLIMRQAARGGHMHPNALVRHIQPDFILMDHTRSAQRRFDLLLSGPQMASRSFDQRR